MSNYLSPNEQVKQLMEWAQRTRPLKHMDWLVDSVESQARGVLAEHGYQSADEVGPIIPEPVGLALEVLLLVEAIRDQMPISLERTMALVFRCGLCAGALPGAERIRKKYGRTNEAKRDRIIELRKLRWSDGRIADKLDQEFPKKSGKPHTEKDVWQYRNRHSID